MSAYYIERRLRLDKGNNRQWRAISWKLTDKAIADAECAKMNAESKVFEYTVTEKPE